jgi:hypothetical protein
MKKPELRLEIITQHFEGEGVTVTVENDRVEIEVDRNYRVTLSHDDLDRVHGILNNYRKMRDAGGLFL